MGLGDALSSIFGGGNDYSYVMPPNVAPKREGETPEAYAARLRQDYLTKDQTYNRDIMKAMGNTKVPQHVLNFDQANKTAGLQNAMNGVLQSRMGQNIDFGTQGSMGQQQGLIDQILAQGRGEGPNPALNQLRMTTDQNVKQGNAMIASQRGINPALAARMAGNQAAGLNQQAVGQAGLQAAQQQLGAQQLGGGLLGQQIGQQTQQAGMNAQQQALYAQLLAGNLGQQRQQDIGQATAQGQAGLNLMTQNLNAEAVRRQAQQAYQNQIANIWNNMNSVNAGVASQNAATDLQYGMGAMSGLSSGLGGLMGMAEGGEVPDPFVDAILRKPRKMADGGMTAYMNFAQGDPFTNQLAASNQAIGNVGQKMQGAMAGLSEGLMSKIADAFMPAMEIGGTPSLGGVKGTNSKFGLMGIPEGSDRFGASLKVSPDSQWMAHKSSVEDNTSFMNPDYSLTPGMKASLGNAINLENQLNPQRNLANPFMSEGGKVLGKAETKGDSEKNDTVPALLSPGEIVIPRTATRSAESAHAFLDKIIQKHEGPSYKEIMKAKEKYHKLAHGGEIGACGYCNGGYV